MANDNFFGSWKVVKSTDDRYNGCKMEIKKPKDGGKTVDFVWTSFPPPWNEVPTGTYDESQGLIRLTVAEFPYLMTLPNNQLDCDEAPQTPTIESDTSGGSLGTWTADDDDDVY